MKKEEHRDIEILSQIQEYSKNYDEKQKNDERKSIFINILKIITGIFLLSLIFLYSDAISSAFFVFSGHQQSTLIDSNYTLSYKDYTISFTPEVYKKILAIHDSAGGNEIKVCLLGTFESKKYQVTALYVPEVFHSTGINIVSQMCDQNTIISFHSHPIESCLFSKEDIDSYKQFKLVNPEGIIGMMCSNSRFAFYRE
jgi:proteasome lid subunit RPN8/RPN11